MKLMTTDRFIEPLTNFIKEYELQNAFVKIDNVSQSLRSYGDTRFRFFVNLMDERDDPIDSITDCLECYIDFAQDGFHTIGFELHEYNYDYNGDDDDEIIDTRISKDEAKKLRASTPNYIFHKYAAQYISNKTCNILVKYGIESTGHLLSMSDDELLEINGIGQSALSKLHILQDTIMEDILKSFNDDGRIIIKHDLSTNQIKKIREMLDNNKK